MSGWLAGKTARLIGTHRAIETELRAAGAVLVADGDCDIIVHVAAPPPHVPAHQQSHEEWRRVLAQGLDERFFAAQAFAAACRERQATGAVLFVGAPEQALGTDQAAAAGALVNLTKTLGVEWARDGIRVNSILTHRQDAVVGRLAAYLVSDYAAYVTGAIMGVDTDD
ncbi:SDR family oxidoreductase [Sphingomonas lacunae]|uniref:SDR family oxidoreductase n=1 Tax=Sphingomonas lacunae TaxID=2698828 RepID=A0A6M4ATQ1_9SPHN|nr:SDR family oxidoreductase [Sphingomonas lacunae]QJQ31419.1 SDR family oxidoreductase [Sphingomonas lacunae]